MQEYLSSLAAGLLNLLPNIFIALVIVALGYYAGDWLSRLLKTALVRHNAEEGVSHLISQVLKWAVISFSAIAALQRFFDVTAFLAGLGILGFTIGFALQNIMQNFVSGVILLIQQPFKAGDFVNAAGYDGSALKIELRTTKLKTLDGRIVFLPNADVLSQPIVNYTRAAFRRVELSIRAAYASDPQAVRAVILKEIRKVTGFVDTPEPLVYFDAFGEISIDLNVFFWVDSKIASTFAAKDAALTLIKKAFERENIEIPLPMQMTYQERKPLSRSRKAKK
ncbi:MAG: mechanosensitive ion channel [Chloroflexi bacterium]|nr:mechanosensitive ion channel [Chloroflexota bacterium]